MKRKRTPEPKIDRAARWLFEAHERRERFAPLPADLAPQSVAEAYAVQAEYVGLRGAQLGPVAGYKIALTTPAMRSMMGMSDSIAGDMLERTLRRGPARVRAADYVRLLVEFEILPPDNDVAVNNAVTRVLADMLGLEQPGPGMSNYAGAE